MRMGQIRPNALVAVVLLTIVVLYLIRDMNLANPPSHFWGIIGSYVTGMVMLAQKLVGKD